MGRRSVICPKCNKAGFLTFRQVRSSYYPEFVSMRTNGVDDIDKYLKCHPEEHELRKLVEDRKKGLLVSGNKYRGKPKYGLIGESESWKSVKDKSEYYKVRTEKYYHFYVGHYDKKLYETQLKNYNNGLRKTKPSGRKWCYVKKGSQIEIIRKDGTTFFARYYDAKRVFSETRTRKLNRRFKDSRSL